jgi:putative MATE family efflux protein
MRKKHVMDLTTGSVTKKLLTFVYPLLIANLLQHLYQATDNAVVGRFVGKEALAAVGSTSSATTLILNMILGLAVGASIVNGNLLGAKKHTELRRSMHSSLVLALVGGILVAIVGNLVARPMLLLMSCPEDIVDDSLVYMRIILCGAPGTMLYNFGSGILRTHGDSKRPMFIMGASGLVNVVLNLVFVLCFDMTVDGVAYATIASKYLSAICVLVILFDPKGEFKLTTRELKFHATESMNIIKVGVPCGVNGIVFSISNVIVQGAVNSFGSVVIAGSVASNNITAFLYQILLAFYSACVSFSGQCYGALKPKRINKLLFTSIGLCCVFMSVVSLALTLWPTPFLTIFNADPDVIEAGTVKLVIMAWSYVIYAASEVVTGCLRGMRKTSITTGINIFCICGIRLLWIWCVCPMAPENYGLLYLCYPVSYIFSLVALSIYYVIVNKDLARKAAAAASGT